MLQACNAGTLIVLIISDVIGDPLETIASGPTVPGTTTDADAVEVLRRFSTSEADIPNVVWEILSANLPHDAASTPSVCRVTHRIIGNNATALTAAKRKAQQLGYAVIHEEEERQGEAQEVGRRLAEMADGLRETDKLLRLRRVCLLSGGEPIVRLNNDAGELPGKGGRNQEVAVTAIDTLWNSKTDGVAILSGGTDGEDGPTDAAGGIVDTEVIQQAKRLKLDPKTALRMHDTYPFLKAAGWLICDWPYTYQRHGLACGARRSGS